MPRPGASANGNSTLTIKNVGPTPVETVLVAAALVRRHDRKPPPPADGRPGMYKPGSHLDRTMLDRQREQDRRRLAELLHLPGAEALKVAREMDRVRRRLGLGFET